MEVEVGYQFNPRKLSSDRFVVNQRVMVKQQYMGPTVLETRVTSWVYLITVGLYMFLCFFWRSNSCIVEIKSLKPTTERLTKSCWFCLVGLYEAT